MQFFLKVHLSCFKKCLCIFTGKLSKGSDYKMYFVVYNFQQTVYLSLTVLHSFMSNLKAQHVHFWIKTSKNQECLNPEK